MKKIYKWLLYRILGQEKFINLLGYFFPLTYKLGILKGNPIYHFHYYVKRIIKPGFTVVDIGANMGYYTRIFSELVGENGSVIAIEPILPFFKQLTKIKKKYSQCILYNYALGDESKTVRLSIPNDSGYLRTGLASVKQDHDASIPEFIFEAPMIRASTLLKDCKKIDYVKCDIEGYEVVVIPELEEVIKKFRPMIQLETFGEQRDFMLKYMSDLGYKRYSLQGKKLIKDLPLQDHFGDFLFVYE
jgi:hypothetical protein